MIPWIAKWQKKHMRGRAAPAKVRKTFRPNLEMLEDRLAPAIITVNTTNDQVDYPTTVTAASQPRRSGGTTRSKNRTTIAVPTTISSGRIAP